MRKFLRNIGIACLFVFVFPFMFFLVAGARATPLAVNKESNVKEEIVYALPYPGILSDHPLFFLKNIRDTILEFLIVDPIRKSEFYILQADKRLVMAQAFVGNSKETFLVESVQKAGEYEEKVYGVLLSMKSSNAPAPSHVVDTYVLSLKKHIEEFAVIAGKVGERYRESIEQAITKDNELLGRVGDLK